MTDIFVFGSNLAGRHGRGSALEAVRNHDAVYGQWYGRQGNSFAIPTKDHKLCSMPLDQISFYVGQFIYEALRNPQDTFNVVAIGCGLAGYKPEQIAPMFRGSPSNVNLPPEFLPYV